jgi:hypothetical protein
VTNCATMGIPPSEAKALSLWEYEAILIEWNHARDPDADLPVFTVDMFDKALDLFEQNPHLLN